jgi:hypothetical protein
MAIESDKDDIKAKINATLEKLRRIQEQKRGGQYAVSGEPSYGDGQGAEPREKPNGDPPDRPENIRIKTSLRQPVHSDGHTHPSFEDGTVERVTSEDGSIDGESTEGCDELKDVRIVQQDDGGEGGASGFADGAFWYGDISDDLGGGSGDLSYGKILETMIIGDVLNTPVFKRKRKIR